MLFMSVKKSIQTALTVEKPNLFCYPTLAFFFVNDVCVYLCHLSLEWDVGCAFRLGMDSRGVGWAPASS